MRSIEGFSLFIFHLNEENNSWWVNSIFHLLYTKAKQISDKRIDWEIANFRNAMKCNEYVHDITMKTNIYLICIVPDAIGQLKL